MGRKTGRQILKEKENNKEGYVGNNEFEGDGVAIYRVSSLRQDAEGWSLGAQERFIREYSKSKGINLVREFVEKESAKKAGRKVFNEMISFVKKNKNIKHILVEKTDRLCRNLKDYVTVDDLGINIHYVKEGNVLTPKSKSNDKFMQNIKMVMAKHYVDNLSEEIIKGKLEKARQGHYPSTAPIGYLNKRLDNGKSIIVIDEKRAMFVRRAFELYSQGNISYKDLARKLSLEGFTTKKDKKVTKRSIEVMLQNPFYIGKFIWQNEIYEGKHAPIISSDLYYKVSDLFDNPKRQRNRKNDFSYSGMFQCECGHYMSVEKQYGEHKSGEYLYLRCKHKELHKSGKGYYISTKEVDKAINDLLESIRVKEEYSIPIKQELIKMHKTRTSDNQSRLEHINNEIKETQNLLDTLLDKLLKGVISDSQYKSAQKKLIEKRDLLLIEQRNAVTNNDKFYEYVENLSELCKKPPQLYFATSNENKKKLLKLVCPNPKVIGSKVILEPLPVFENIKNIKNLKKLETRGVEPLSKMD